MSARLTGAKDETRTIQGQTRGADLAYRDTSSDASDRCVEKLAFIAPVSRISKGCPHAGIGFGRDV